jgi:hypothetical protein
MLSYLAKPIDHMKTETIQFVGRIDQIVRDYFSDNPQIEQVRAKDLMPLFIKREIFNKDYRDGLLIRNIFRELDKEQLQHLLQHCKVQRN